jgi:hypothetical protein
MIFFSVNKVTATINRTPLCFPVEDFWQVKILHHAVIKLNKKVSTFLIGTNYAYIDSMEWIDVSIRNEC